MRVSVVVSIPGIDNHASFLGLTHHSSSALYQPPRLQLAHPMVPISSVYHSTTSPVPKLLPSNLRVRNSTVTATLSAISVTCTLSPSKTVYTYLLERLDHIVAIFVIHEYRYWKRTEFADASTRWLVDAGRNVEVGERRGRRRHTIDDTCHMGKLWCLWLVLLESCRRGEGQGGRPDTI